MTRDRCVLMFFIANPVCVTENFISTICQVFFLNLTAQTPSPAYCHVATNLIEDRANGKSLCNKLPDKSVSNAHFSK